MPEPHLLTWPRPRDQWSMMRLGDEKSVCGWVSEVVVSGPRPLRTLKLELQEHNEDPFAFPPSHSGMVQVQGDELDSVYKMLSLRDNRYLRMAGPVFPMDYKDVIMITELEVLEPPELPEVWY